jgi:hypothetical protein
MKNFNNYLEIIQEVKQSGNSEKWKEATKSRGIPRVFAYNNLLDDWEDLKPKLKKTTIEIEIEGEIIENYANTGYNVFREIGTDRFYYLDTHKL